MKSLLKLLLLVQFANLKTVLRISIITSLFFVASCKKEQSPVRLPDRKITFLLYTTKDFSADAHIINFRLNIRNATHTLFDSALAPMKIKDIPNAASKLMFQKIVNETGDLAVGLRYTINDVGNSSFTDTCSAGELFKVVDYDFR